jgi:hypothetical protein
VTPRAMQSTLSRTSTLISGFDMRDPMLPSSGDLVFDKALGRQLVRLARDFSVRPGFGFVDDRFERNAMASNLTRLPGTRGTVLFGLHFMRTMLNAGAGGDISVLGVCAHEFAHIHQFFSGDHAELASKHDTSKLVELHADYLSGYFIAQIKKERPSITLQKFGAFLYSIGSYDTDHPDFHGTPDERIEAAEQGFRSASLPFATAAATGKAYVIAHFQ